MRQESGGTTGGANTPAPTSAGSPSVAHQLMTHDSNSGLQPAIDELHHMHNTGQTQTLTFSDIY